MSGDRVSQAGSVGGPMRESHRSEPVGTPLELMRRPNTSY
jgi:hypothetical protein